MMATLESAPLIPHNRQSSVQLARGIWLRIGLVLVVITIMLFMFETQNDAQSIVDTNTQWEGKFKLNTKGMKLSGVHYDLRQGLDWDPQKCKSQATIARELSILQQVSSNIRLNSISDCDLSAVLTSARQYNITVWLGVWISSNRKDFDNELKTLQLLVNKTDLIDGNIVGFNIGNEAILRRDVTVDQAIMYLVEFKAFLVRNLILGRPVTIIESIYVMTSNVKLIEAVDIVAVNSYPFWETQHTSVSAATTLFQLNMNQLVNATERKQVVIMETGWATAGGTEQLLASPDCAVKYLNEFRKITAANEWEYYYYGAFDSPYRALYDPSKNIVQASFGLLYANGTMKTEFLQAGYWKT